MAATPETEPAHLPSGDVVDRIAQLPGDILGFEEDQQPEEAATPAEEPAPEEAAEDVETDEPEADGVDGEEDTSEEEIEASGEEEDPIFEVTLPGGEKSEIPLSELAAGYSRLEDYKQKTAQLAQQRKEFEQSRDAELEGVKQYEQQLRSTLEFYQQLNPVGQEPSRSMLDPNSQEYNPEEYLRQKAEYDSRVQTYQQTAQRLGYVQQQEQERQKQAIEETTRREQAKLKEVWPELFDEDPTVQTTARTALVNGLQSYYDVDPQTISQVLDHRFYRMAKDALAYRAMKQDAPAVTAKLKVKPKVVKPGARAPQPKPGQKKAQEGRRALKKSGDMRDFASAIEGLLPD